MLTFFLVALLAILGGSSWTIKELILYFFNFEIYVGTPIVLLSVAFIFILFRPTLLARAVSAAVNLGIKFLVSKDLELKAEVDEISVFGRQIRGLRLLHFSGDRATRIFGVSEVKLTFSVDTKHQIHASSTPLLLLRIQGTYLNIPEELLRQMGLLKRLHSESQSGKQEPIVDKPSKKVSVQLSKVSKC